MTSPILSVMDLVVVLDRTSKVPLYQQLAEDLRQAVLQKRLKPNQKLPPSRVLAKSLAISRATVTQSYDQLLSEGYFEARRGSGTFVCPQLPDDYLQTESTDLPNSEPSALIPLSRLGHDLLAIEQLNVPDPQTDISFRFSSPDTEQFSMELWRRLLARHCYHSSAVLNYTPDAAGYI
ncbi:MAG: GntR family transcriptional regulator, partial [Leptolyngbya sp. SIO1D8]|nr:GntR family transcriptional regulator [Leptolyngbya sp. SIO1D8]